MKLREQVLVSVFLLVTAGLGSPALAGEISGKQYVVLGNDPNPLADNKILFFPCIPLNNTCEDIKKKISVLISEAKQKVDFAESVVGVYRKAYLDCTPGEYSTCDDFESKLKESREQQSTTFGYWISSAQDAFQKLSQLKNMGSTRTTFDGNYSFECPTKACLVYSIGPAGRTSSQWIEILPAGQKDDLSGSKAYSVNLPDNL